MLQKIVTRAEIKFELARTITRYGMASTSRRTLAMAETMAAVLRAEAESMLRPHGITVEEHGDIYPVFRVQGWTFMSADDAAVCAEIECGSLSMDVLECMGVE